MLHLTAATKMALSCLSHKLNSYELSLRNHLLFATVVITYMNVKFPLWFQFSTDKRKFFKAACREMVIINFPAIWQKWNLTKLPEYTFSKINITLGVALQYLLPMIHVTLYYWLCFPKSYFKTCFFPRLIPESLLFFFKPSTSSSRSESNPSIYHSGLLKFFKGKK